MKGQKIFCNTDNCLPFLVHAFSSEASSSSSAATPTRSSSHDSARSNPSRRQIQREVPQEHQAYHEVIRRKISKTTQEHQVARGSSLRDLPECLQGFHRTFGELREVSVLDSDSAGPSRTSLSNCNQKMVQENTT